MNNMNILCATDRNFLYPTYVTMSSIMENHPNITVNFYLFAGEDVTIEDKQKLQEFINSKGNTITYLDVDSSQYSNYVISERFPLSAYYRLMAHAYLPSTVERVLYLDVDIIVNKNIYNDFYNMDFGNKYLIVTSHNPDPSFYNMLDETIVNLEAAAKGEFFNSGVILMNLKKFREENITLDDYNRAYESCEKQGIKVFYDQGLLNYMFFDKSIYLSSMDYNYRYSIPRDYARRLDPDIEYKKAIIHYTGMKQPYKPWDLRLTSEDIEEYGNVPYQNDYFYVSEELNELCEVWWQYAEKTPVYESLLHDMEVKRKWWRRNLKEFSIRHNRMVKQYKDLSAKLPQVKTVTRDKIVYDLPADFHGRAYKLGCAICKPYWWLKSIFKRNNTK